MSKHLTPYDVVLHMFGHPAKVADICKVNAKAPYGWRHPSLHRDAGDIPSARHMRLLLARAAADGLPLTAEDLLWGADADELAARLPAPPAPAATPMAAE